MNELHDYIAEIHIIAELPARGLTAAHRAMRDLADEIAGDRRNWFTNLRVAGEWTEVELHPEETQSPLDGDSDIATYDIEVALHPVGATPTTNSLLNPVERTLSWDGDEITTQEGTTYDPDADYNNNETFLSDVALDTIIDALNLSPLAFENNESTE